MSGTGPAVFLDRDGVLIEDHPYRSSPEGLTLVPGVAQALRALRGAGFALLVVTNQSGVARGYITERQVQELHRRLAALLDAEGASIDAWLHCPHHPTVGAPELRFACECRKPAPGMLYAGRDLLGLQLSRSFLVGDRSSDVEAGNRAKVTSLLLRSERQKPAAPRDERALARPAAVISTLAEAAAWILERAHPRPVPSLKDTCVRRRLR